MQSYHSLPERDIRTNGAAPGPAIRQGQHRRARRTWRQLLPRWSRMAMPDAMVVRAEIASGRKWR